MKIRYVEATGCPAGQFVVEAENEQDRAILANFTSDTWAADGWRFWRHGASYYCGVSWSGVTSFNFGYIKRSTTFLMFERWAYCIERFLRRIKRIG